MVVADIQAPQESGWVGTAATHPSAAGPAGAWSQCPAAWPPGCEEGCSCHSGQGGHSVAGWGGGSGAWGPGAQKTPPPTEAPLGRLRPLPVWQSPSPYHHLAIHSAHPLASDLWGGATAQGSHAELGGGGRRARGRGERAAAGPGQGAGGLTIHLGAVNLEGRDRAGSTLAPPRPHHSSPPPHPTPVT